MGQRTGVVLVAGWLAFVGPVVADDATNTPDVVAEAATVQSTAAVAIPKMYEFGTRTFASRGLSKAIGTDIADLHPGSSAATVSAHDVADRSAVTALPENAGPRGPADTARDQQPHSMLLAATDSKNNARPTAQGTPMPPAAAPLVAPTTQTAPTTLKPGLMPAVAPAAAVPAAAPTTQPAPVAPWPKTLPEAKAEAEAKAAPQTVMTQWPQADIDLAHARCTALLKGIDAVTIPEASMRQGECGAPAPVRLVSIGRNPEVSFSPPPIVTCDMVVAMHTWVKSDLQPLAKKHLGAPVIKIETMSDYSCRNAYGRTRSKLSEHGRANALDIRGFTTAKGEAMVLLEHWGPTARDVAAQVAAARLAAEKLAQEKAAAERAAQIARAGEKGKPGETGSTAQGRAATGATAVGNALRDGASTLTDGLPQVRITVPGIGVSTGQSRDGTAFSEPASRLGGPKQTPAIPTVAAATAKTDPLKQEPHKPAAADRDPASAKSRFLRDAHTAACRIFGTTLGPEANNAHRNHFHVDMAERRSANICE